jgi:hypothetical protein
MARRNYRDFLDAVARRDPRLPLIRIYHAVRNIPYGSTGVREPMEVIENNFGSCSGKHLLLRDLLREEGFEAEIITMFTYFNRDMPIHESYPAELKRLCRETDVPDFHHYVRVRVNGDWLRLDATWHDRLISYGFPVNQAWSGEGDTILAATAIEEYPNIEDLIPRKEELVLSLPADQRNRPARFFQLVTEWISGLSSGEGRYDKGS